MTVMPVDDAYMKFVFTTTATISVGAFGVAQLIEYALREASYDKMSRVENEIDATREGLADKIKANCFVTETLVGYVEGLDSRVDSRLNGLENRMASVDGHVIEALSQLLNISKVLSCIESFVSKVITSYKRTWLCSFFFCEGLVTIFLLVFVR